MKLKKYKGSVKSVARKMSIHKTLVCLIVKHLIISSDDDFSSNSLSLSLSTLGLFECSWKQLFVAFTLFAKRATSLCVVIIMTNNEEK